MNNQLPAMTKADRQNMMLLLDIDLDNLSTNDKALILYVEAQCVDAGGYGNSASLTDEDQQRLTQFQVIGLLRVESYWDWIMLPEQRYFNEWVRPPEKNNPIHRGRDYRFEPSNKLIDLAAQFRRERIAVHLKISSYEEYAK